MRPTRKLLKLISENDGLRHPRILKRCLENYRPTFWEFLALITLMEYYFYQDDLIQPVILNFYQQYRPKFVARWPRETEKQRLILIKSNAYACSTALENDSDLERITANFDKLYNFNPLPR